MNEMSSRRAAGFTVQNGNNMPVQSPLIPDPFVPYNCPDNRNLFVVCRTERAMLEKYMAPTPFEPIDDRYIVYCSDFSRCDKVPFMDAGIIVPVRFGQRTGGNFLFEYEDQDAAIAAGRDLWGYPKKYADIEMKVEGERVNARVVRKGVAIMELDCDLSRPAPDTPKLVTTPHLNLHVQPGPDGKVLNRRVIERDTSPDFELEVERKGTASVTLRSLPTDPLAELQPREILGAMYVSGYFHATEKNGWGRTVAEV